jgi:hypothetical protein
VVGGWVSDGPAHTARHRPPEVEHEMLEGFSILSPISALQFDLDDIQGP